MPLVRVLTKNEIAEFNSPPKLTSNDREKAFRITRDVKSAFSSIRKPLNQLGFMLQLGYLRLSGQFFKPEQFTRQDAKYLSQHLLGYDISWDLDSYPLRTHRYHQKVIGQPFLQGSQGVWEDHQEHFSAEVHR